MSKPIRPEYVIFNHKESFFVQKKENVIKSGSVVNIYIVYSLYQKTINSNNALKTVYLVQLKLQNLVILQILINTFILAMVLDLIL